MAAAAAALRSSTAVTCSAISMVGTRRMYWISASPAGRLSAVAWPAVRIASLMGQHGIAQRLGALIHEHQRVIGTGRAHAGMGLGDRRTIAAGKPALRLIA